MHVPSIKQVNMECIKAPVTGRQSEWGLWWKEDAQEDVSLLLLFGSPGQPRGPALS